MSHRLGCFCSPPAYHRVSCGMVVEEADGMLKDALCWPILAYSSCYETSLGHPFHLVFLTIFVARPGGVELAKGTPQALWRSRQRYLSLFGRTRVASGL